MIHRQLSPTATEFVMHDVDCWPETTEAISYYISNKKEEEEEKDYVHIYGIENTMGGIFRMRDADFEKVGGYPWGLYGWGGEDGILKRRLQVQGIQRHGNLVYTRHHGLPHIKEDCKHYRDKESRNKDHEKVAYRTEFLSNMPPYSIIESSTSQISADCDFEIFYHHYKVTWNLI